MGPRLLLLAAAVAVVTTVNSRAGLGWTLDETIAHYGQPEVADIPTGDARKEYLFTKIDGHDGTRYNIDVCLFNGKTCRVSYERWDANGTGLDFSKMLVKAFFEVNAPGAIWKDLGMKPADEYMRAHEFWTTGEEGTASEITACLSPTFINPDNKLIAGELSFSNNDNSIGAEQKLKAAKAAPTHTVEELALAAWNEDKMLPGNDMKYNWFLIGANEADWKAYFHKNGSLQPADDQKFDDAFDAIAHRSEDRLKARAFQNSQ